VELEPGHSRHLHVRDQAGCVLKVAVTHENATVTKPIDLKRSIVPSRTDSSSSMIEITGMVGALSSKIAGRRCAAQRNEEGNEGIASR
jgi:hypothetical protein